MNEICNHFLNFISTNQEPAHHKIIVSLLTVGCFGLSIYVLSWILFYFRNIDILKVGKYSILNCLMWILGSIILQFLLISTKIISYNIVSFLVVAMLWDNVYQKLFSQSRDKDIINAGSLEK